MSRLIRRSAAGALGATCAAVLLGVGAASAHIEASPAAVEAGRSATVSFGVEHGCDGSNTTQLEFKTPDGVTDAKPVDKPGWTTSATGGTITFAGGNLDANTADTFSITFTAPATPGLIRFPVVQTCAVGETAWIEIAADGQPEPDHPAPAVLVTAGPPTSDQLAPAHDDDDATESTVASTVDPAATVPASTDTATATATDTATATADTATSTTTASSDDSSNTGVIVGIVIGAVVVIGGALLLANRRKGTTPR